jgi:hypothetical protein
MDAEALADATFAPLRVPRALRRRLAGALAIAFLAGALGAQGMAPATLRMQPHVGDTLHMRFEQEVLMTGITKVHGLDTTLVTRTVTLVLARVLVESSDSTGCTLVAITDSVAITTQGSQALSPGDPSRRAMQGRRITLKLKPDGSAATVNSPEDLDTDVGQLVTTMPAVLPHTPVAMGATWENSLAGGSAGGRLRVKYHLDSLTAARAFIGLRGLIARDSSEGGVGQSARMASAGAVTGALTLDRARGWWADSKIVMTINSIITPAAATPGPPVRVQTRITQRMHTENAPPAPRPRG